RQFYGDSIQGRVLCERLSSFVQLYTLYGSVRPFGCSVLLGCVDKQGPQLFMIEPSGTSWVCPPQPQPPMGFIFHFAGLLCMCHWQRKEDRQNGTGETEAQRYDSP